MNSENYIHTIEKAEEVLSDTVAALFYFSKTSCAVGEAFEPKVRNLLTEKFPKINFYTIDINLSPSLAAKFSAFVEPTILLFFEGKETIRKSRNIGIFELENAIKRPYKLIFE
jgi:thioredoxin 1